MSDNRRRIGQDMLVAVQEVTLLPPARDPHLAYTEFWRALSEFVPEYIPGQFHMELFDDGRVVATFHPQK